MSPARRTFALLVLVCLLPLWLSGCYKKAASSSDLLSEYDDARYDEEEEYYDYAEDGAGGGGMAGPPPAPPAEAERMVVADSPTRARGAKKEKFKANRREQTTETTTKDVPDANSDETVAEPEPLDVEAPDEPAPVSKKRQIIYTATMQVSVYDLDAALAVVESLPDRYGGWMQQRVDNQVVLRIPADELEQAMATVAELGVVDYRLLEALDVTAEYTDLESRIRILEQMQAQLQLLLARAKSVEQALEIRKALDAITLELEAARAQMRELAKSIAFSTLILRLVQRGPMTDVPSSNDPFRWVDELGVEATDYR